MSSRRCRFGCGIVAPPALGWDAPATSFATTHDRPRFGSHRAATGHATFVMGADSAEPSEGTVESISCRLGGFQLLIELGETRRPFACRESCETGIGGDEAGDKSVSVVAIDADDYDAKSTGVRAMGVCEFVNKSS